MCIQTQGLPFLLPFTTFFKMDINFFSFCVFCLYSLCADALILLLGWKGSVSYGLSCLEISFFLLAEQVFTLCLGSDIRIPKSKEQCQNILKEFTHLLLQARIHLFFYSLLCLSNHPPILLSGIHGAPQTYLFIQSINIYRVSVMYQKPVVKCECKQ